MTRIDEVLTRLRAEFLEMPGMRLTREQVQRLCGVEPRPCQTALDWLVDAEFLCVNAHGQYARVAGQPRLVEYAKGSGGKRQRSRSRGGMSDRPPASPEALDTLIAKTNRCQVLVIGTSDAVERSLAGLMPHLEAPVCWWSPNAPLPSPRDVKTLVVRNLEVLTPERQQEFRLWLERAAEARPRVVSTTTIPLFERVAAGLFLDALYYSLNTVTLSDQLS